MVDHVSQSQQRVVVAGKLDFLFRMHIGGWGCDTGAKRMTPYREYGVACDRSIGGRQINRATSLLGPSEIRAG